jgi:hypothetical protein
MRKIFRRSIQVGIVFVVLVGCGAVFAPAYATCNFNQHAFGTPLKMVMSSLNVQESTESLPSIPKLSHRVVLILGSQICPADVSFATVRIAYNFLADQLVSMQLQLRQPASSALTLLDWAMNRYGRPVLESKGPVGKMSGGQWSWDSGTETAFFFFVRQENIAVQQLDITSTAYQTLAEQRWQAMEAMQRKP